MSSTEIHFSVYKEQKDKGKYYRPLVIPKNINNEKIIKKYEEIKSKEYIHIETEENDYIIYFGNYAGYFNYYNENNKNKRVLVIHEKVKKKPISVINAAVRVNRVNRAKTATPCSSVMTSRGTTTCCLKSLRSR